jgi:hypothetical protein
MPPPDYEESPDIWAEGGTAAPTPAAPPVVDGGSE